MHFFDSSPTESRKQGVLKAYSSAVSLIQLMTKCDESFSFYSYICAYHLRMFLVATCILLKVLRSSYRDDVDFESGKRLCNQATIAISKCTVASNDSAGKWSKLAAQVWHSSNTKILDEPPELMVKSRLGAR